MPNHVSVVFDTSVLIPLMIKASQSTRLFRRLRAASWEVAVSEPILAEARDKMFNKPQLRRWLGVPDERIERFLLRLGVRAMR